MVIYFLRNEYSLLFTHNTETGVIFAVVWGVAEPSKNLAVDIDETPGTTAYYAERTRRRAGIGSAAVYSVVPVVTPFKHVSAHVVYAKPVCILDLYFVGFTAAVTAIPCYIIYCIASAVGCS